LIVREAGYEVIPLIFLSESNIVFIEELTIESRLSCGKQNQPVGD